MIDDHRDSVESVKSTAKNILEHSTEKEKQIISSQLMGLISRWDAVNVATADHQRVLEAALLAAKGYKAKVEPFLTWIDTTEKRMVALDGVGADVEMIGQQISTQRVCVLYAKLFTIVSIQFIF